MVYYSKPGGFMNQPQEQKPFILIIDDNPTNLDVLIEILQNDYRLSVAKTGKKALEFIKNNTPDLILLDVVMPEMDGFEVCQILKSRPDTRSIPVIFISSVNDAENVSKGYAIGGSDYLSKPFVPVEVRTRIKDQLDLFKFRQFS